MSVSHSWSGELRLKSLQTRSSEVAALIRFLRCLRVGRPCSRGFGHQLVHELPRHDDLPAQPQLRPHPPITIDPSRLRVDLADQRSQPLAPQLHRRRRPAPPAEVPRRRHTEDPATPFHVIALPGQSRNHRVLPFGRTPLSANNADAFLVTSNSVSNSRILRRATLSSDHSALDKPGRSPRSTRSCSRHRYTVASLTPISTATTLTGRPDRTSSTTRRRNSGAYDLGTTDPLSRKPDSHESRPENGDQIKWTEKRGPVRAPLLDPPASRRRRASGSRARRPHRLRRSSTRRSSSRS